MRRRILLILQMMDSPALLLDQATVRFDDLVALDGVSMELPAGALVGIIGPSGAGKTTAVRLLTGGLAPSEGTVQVLGEDPRSFRRSTRRRIGYMPQHFSLYSELTAHENVDFVASIFGMLLPSRRRRVPEILKLVELWDARGRRANALSGGMKRRLELAATLVHDPVLLLLDEPTAGIDPLLRTVVWQELTRLREAGRTILVTTQYVTEAEECELVALIAEGRLIAFGTPDELRHRATGGEQVEIQTTRPVAPRDWAALPDARAVRSIGENRILVTVPVAAAAIPSIVEALRETGNEVTEAIERRLSFDDVFAVLVHAARDGKSAEGARDGSAPVEIRTAETPPAEITADQRVPSDDQVTPDPQPDAAGTQAGELGAQRELAAAAAAAPVGAAAAVGAAADGPAAPAARDGQAGGDAA